MLSLSFDLLSSPTCCGDGTRGEIAGGSRFFDEFSDPFLLIIACECSIREGFAEITRLRSVTVRESHVRR